MYAKSITLFISSAFLSDLQLGSGWVICLFVFYFCRHICKYSSHSPNHLTLFGNLSAWLRISTAEEEVIEPSRDLTLNLRGTQWADLVHDTKGSQSHVPYHNLLKSGGIGGNNKKRHLCKWDAQLRQTHVAHLTLLTPLQQHDTLLKYLQ